MSQYSDIDVVNIALGRASGEPIETLDDGTPLSTFAQQQYPLCRAWALGLARWNFAARVKPLNQLQAPEVAPLPYVYALPADIVGQVFAYRETADVRCEPLHRHFMTEEGVALEKPAVFAEYTRLVPEAEWPAWFMEVVATAFAAAVARNKQNVQLFTSLWNEAVGEDFNSKGVPGGKLLSAMQRDGQNSPERALDPWDPGPLACARFIPNVGGQLYILATPPVFIDFP